MMDQYRISRFGDSKCTEDSKTEYDQYQMKKHRPLAKLSENIVQNIRNIESEVKQRNQHKDRSSKESKGPNIKDYLQDENKKKLLEKTKELYMKLPKSKEDIFKF